MDPAVAALLGVALGVLLKAGLDAVAWAVRRRREEGLAIEERMRPWRLEQLRATRELLVRQLEWMVAMVRGDIPAIEAAGAAESPLDGNLALLGDAELIAEYQAVLVALREALGGKLTVAMQVRANDLRIAVLTALDAQTERILRGQALREISPADRDRLFDGSDLARRLRLTDEQPPLTVRLAAAIMNWRHRVQRH